MKRRLGLCRDLLLATENVHSRYAENITNQWSKHQIDYHIYLLQDAGYFSEIYEGELLPRLTWKGHDILQYLRDDAKWQTLMEETEDAFNVSWDMALIYMQS